jgi:CxxC motif-containing protein (DUF1111 family)
MNTAPIFSRSEKSQEKHARRKIRIAHGFSATLFVISICFAAAGAFAQHFDRDHGPGGGGGGGGDLTTLDPGPRPGAAGAGSPIQGLTTTGQLPGFQNGLSQFIETEPVSLAGGPGNGGLGPAFNGDSCGSCHSQPAPGGTSPRIDVSPAFLPNPQFTAGQVAGGTNTIPFFVTANGPVREARFKSDSGVHDLFTIQGRTDVSNPPNNCTLAQPDFSAEAARNNLSFRIPTPVFGAGLIENISEDTLMANLAASTSLQLGIAGTFNRSGNDGSITRFGWKAQNKSLIIFAGEAYNVEMGVTNEQFPDERGYPPTPLPAACLVNPTPEDITIFDPSLTLSDVTQFAVFMRFLDQPTPACGGTSGVVCSQPIQRGATVFTSIGCANCHTSSLTTTTSEFTPAALSGVQANLFSDLALHHMGEGLADGVTQGGAGPDQFRTSPLWGIGQRVFFLHDGRTDNLYTAIQEHRSPGSEANRVINNYNQLSVTDQQNLILFLRSL